MCTTETTYHLIHQVRKASSIKKARLTRYVTKEEILKCQDQALTIQFEHHFKYQDFAQCYKNDWKVILVDLPATLREYQNDHSFLRSWPELLQSSFKQEFLYNTNLGYKADEPVKDWADSEKIYFHIAKQLHELTQMVVFYNYEGCLSESFELILGLGLLLPGVKIVSLEDYGVNVFRDTSRKAEVNGKVLKMRQGHEI